MGRVGEGGVGWGVFFYHLPDVSGASLALLGVVRVGGLVHCGHRHREQLDVTLYGRIHKRRGELWDQWECGIRKELGSGGRRTAEEMGV